MGDLHVAARGNEHTAHNRPNSHTSHDRPTQSAKRTRPGSIRRDVRHKRMNRSSHRTEPAKQTIKCRPDEQSPVPARSEVRECGY